MACKNFSLYKVTLSILTLVLAPLTLISRADITVDGDVTPPYNGLITWLLTDPLYVGNEADGQISIVSDPLGAYLVHDTNNIFLGAHEDVNGVVTTNGAGTSFATDMSLFVGPWGTGTFSVLGGGIATAADTIIGGYDPFFENLVEYFDPNADLGGGTGTVTVSGEGSQLNTNTLMVSFSGEGTLEIANGGRVTSQMGMIGAIDGGTGTVEVRDPNSLWSNNGNLILGAWGDANLTISNGAKVQTPEAFLGGMPFDAIDENYNPSYLPTGSGTLMITGDGSEFNVTGDESLYVGYFGEGTLDVNDGGTVTSDLAMLGVAPDAVGTVTVQDANSTWTTDELIVGAWGEGNLTISNGGDVTAETAWIGG
ncbi:MAG: hypothetical protein JXM79_23960, partial [Sedimentisphaerales bacterium]|nr:hypothetical protein [Sedimentisphaerales bacterium]